MRHLKSGRKLNRHSSHRLALYRNQAKSLLTHGRITTTVPKAKELRGFVDHLIHLAKRGDLHARRLVLRDLQDVKLVRKLFDEIAPRYRDRQGGTPGSSSWRSAGGGRGAARPGGAGGVAPPGPAPPEPRPGGLWATPCRRGTGAFPKGPRVAVQTRCGRLASGVLLALAQEAQDLVLELPDVGGEGVPVLLQGFRHLLLQGPKLLTLRLP